MKKIIVIGLMCTLMVMSGCKKRYVSPLETPSMTKAAEDKAYDIDFVQVNNDVIETLQDQEIFGFVKALAVSGDNDTKEIVVDADITENVSEDAIEFFLSEITKAIVSAAHTQDFRIDEWSEDGFGNLFDLYSYRFRITCGDETVAEEEFKQGDSIPFDPSMTLEQVVG